MVGFTLGGPLENKLTFLANPASFTTVDTTEVRTCVCGFPLSDLYSRGKQFPMTNISEVDFNATRLGYAHNFPSNSDTNANTVTINRTSWFSFPDRSWITMQMPAALIHYILSAIGKMLDGRGWESADLSITCTPAVTYLGYEFGVYSLVVKNSKKDGKKLTPDQVTEYQIKMATEAIHGKGGTWYSGDDKSPSIDAGAAVVCNYSFKQDLNGEMVDVNRSAIFTSNKDKHAFGIYPGHLKVEGKNGWDIIKLINSKVGATAWKPTSQAVTVDAFVFNEDLAEFGEDVSQVLHVPNRFQFEFCTGLLKELTLGFNLDDTNFAKPYDDHIASCPLISNTATLKFPDKKLDMIPIYKFADLKSGELLDIKVNSKLAGFVMNNYIPKVFDASDPSAVIVFNDEYTGQLEERKEARIQAIKDTEEMLFAEKEKEPSVKANEPLIDHNQMALDMQQKQDDILAIQNEESSSAGSGKESKKDEESTQEDDAFMLTNTPTVTGNGFVPPTDLSQEVTLRDCEEGLLELQRRVIGYNPKTEDDVYVLIEQFMFHSREKCLETIKMLFQYGRVRNNDPDGPIMNYTVRQVTPEELKEAGINEDNHVFEIHFYNHYFDAQKDNLYYIPSTEIVNEWNTFSDILFSFKDFAIEFLSNQLTPYSLTHTIFDRLKGLLETRSESGKWEPFITSTGTLDNSKNDDSETIYDQFDKNPNAKYVYLVAMLMDQQSKIGLDFYDFIYECWTMGDKYLMIKIMGTRLSFQIMINVFATDDKLDKVLESIADVLADTYLKGDSSVVSVNRAKRIINNSLHETAKREFGLNLRKEKINLEGMEEFSADETHEYMYEYDSLDFIFDVYSPFWERSIVVRGFIHDKESLPIVNIFFTTDFFQSEYIIPLGTQGEFTSYIDGIMKECLYHQFLLSKEVARVENPATSEDDLLESQKLGRYSFKILLNKVLELLGQREVYGCILKIERASSEVTEDGQDNDEETSRKHYKWEDPIPFDPSGEFTMLRSNTLWDGSITSKCSPGETGNPMLLNLHSTFIGEDKNGYALSVNKLDNSSKKDVKTTYHFVQYQDYAHMRVFEHYIKGIFGNLFPKKVTPDEDTGDGKNDD